MRLVIFDCDGVMFDSRAANEAFYNHIRHRFGLPDMSPEEVDYVHMATTDESINRIIPEALRAEAQTFRLTVDYAPYNRLMTPEPHLIELLEYLRPRFKTAVCTNRSYTIIPLLEHFRLSVYFDTVVSILDVHQPKPDPEMIELALKRLNVPAREALYIGDSELDARAARAADVRLAAYKNPDLEADYHLDDLAQVKDILSQ
ncbi:MAG: HAD-IA family hydrolase [Thermodesulfobacteriota bacterium]